MFAITPVIGVIINNATPPSTVLAKHPAMVLATHPAMVHGFTADNEHVFDVRLCSAGCEP